MSKAQFDAFYKKVGEDENLKQQMMSLRGDSQTVYAKITEIARAEGYDIDPQDFEEAFTNDGPLDDAAVAQVAGGCYKGDPDCSKVCGECCGTFLGTYIGRQ
jgi:predicted ribosomally synthesized peptide with nif11-like leader